MYVLSLWVINQTTSDIGTLYVKSNYEVDAWDINGNLLTISIVIYKWQLFIGVTEIMDILYISCFVDCDTYSKLGRTNDKFGDRHMDGTWILYEEISEMIGMAFTV